MTPIETAAYDAMMEDRDYWRDLAERREREIFDLRRMLSQARGDLAFAETRQKQINGELTKALSEVARQHEAGKGPKTFS